MFMRIMAILCAYPGSSTRSRTMPPDTTRRDQRLDALRGILASGNVRGQGELVDLLRGRGFTVTQSSVSRDLRALAVAKVRGAYRLPTDAAPDRLARLGEVLRDSVRGTVGAGANLLVVHTVVGMATRVGSLLDRSGWTEILGTVAGDDTLFVAVGSLRDRKRVGARLEQLGAAREMEHA
ncbi:MAG: arginine repressor [Planctomycetes bacterium]|nr:arginine repressor [Planctomycetota bacterium]